MVELVDDGQKSAYGLSGKFRNEDDSCPINLKDHLNELAKSKKNFEFNDEFITIESHPHMELILQSYADSDKRKILELTTGEARTTMEILKACNIPTTSAYRKVIELVEQYLLIPSGSFFKNGRKIIKYKSIFESVEINMIRNKVTITVKQATMPRK